MANVAARLTISMLLNVTEIGYLGDVRVDEGEGRTTLDMLIAAAIVQANVAPLTRDPDLQRTYATFQAAPPDEIRRPVSIRAVANSLRLSYETTRRRIMEMSRQGLCVTSPAGVYVSQEVLLSPQYMAGSIAMFDMLRRFYLRLRELGIAPEATRPPPDAEAFPFRAILRLFGDYFLRSFELATEDTGDLVPVMLLLGVMRANTEHLPDSPQAVDGEGGLDVDSQRRPVTVAALAARMGFPLETARRNLSQLVAEGRCLRTNEGLIVPAAVLAQPAWVRFADANLSNLKRLFASLDELGVLAIWAPPE